MSTSAGKRNPPLRKRRLHWLFAALLCCPFVMLKDAAGESERTASEYQLKAAYLLNFARFIEWPSGAFATADSQLVIGIAGDDPFGSMLEEVVLKERVGNHPLAVKRFKSSDDVSDCQILFIGRSEEGRVAGILGSLKGKPVLTVSELDRFGQRGGMIRLYEQQQNVRFEINREAAQAGHLNLSSRLLKLAGIVKTEPNP